MNKKPLFLAISILSIIAAIAIAGPNCQSVPLVLFGTQVSLSFCVIGFGMFALGCLSTLPMALNKAKEIKSEKIQVAWQQQDEKLKEELTNDKIKLLEAKISTLDAALKQALKKKQ